jgi:restriction system protein
VNLILLGILALGVAVVLIGLVLSGVASALAGVANAYARLTGWLINIRANREKRKRDELLSFENNRLIERERRLRAYVESIPFEKPLFLSQAVRSVPDSLVAQVNFLQGQSYHLESPPKFDMRVFSPHAAPLPRTSNEVNISEISEILLVAGSRSYSWMENLVRIPYSGYPHTFPEIPIIPAEPEEFNPEPITPALSYQLPLFTPTSEFSEQEIRAEFEEQHKEILKKINTQIAQEEAVIRTIEELSGLGHSAYQRLRDEYEFVRTHQTKIWTEAKNEYLQHASLHRAGYERQNQDLLAQLASICGTDDTALKNRALLTLKNLPLKVALENHSVEIDTASRMLIAECQFPHIADLEFFKLVSLKSGLTKKPPNKTELGQSQAQLHPALCLRLLYEISRIDDHDLIDVVVINGWVEYLDSRTGNRQKAYCASLLARKEEALGLNLKHVNPLDAFKALKGMRPAGQEFSPIAPQVRINMDDARFVDEKEVLRNLDAGSNIATMDWEDFEHLCRELFERVFESEGGVVKVTQASRDHGVDAIIFDPHPIKGGKIVVQAKRYTNTVDVSAVRDLFGTVMNEGAMKGILVTTSWFGADSYEFIKDKTMLTLINGQELLSMLLSYGYKFHIDLAAAKLLNAERR